MNTDFEVPRHPIGVAAERTGLTPDVIRAWERRYGAVEPERDDAGQRVYSDAEIERLRLLHRATEGGRSISSVVDLPGEALAELVRGDEAAKAELRPAGADVDRLYELATSLNGPALEASLRRSMLAQGLSGFAETVAAPLLHRLGEAWHAGEITPSQEHVASAAISRVLTSLRDGSGDGPIALVGTLSGERHEVGALMAAAAAELAGWRVVYLGPDLPPEDLVDAAQRSGARALCVSVVYPGSSADVQSRFRSIRASLPEEVEVYAGGAGAETLVEELELFGVRCPSGMTELREALERQAEALA
ncbi:MAG: MerR family transcriptional regulator [Longimicrobiales bacterium]|nr:MerR family transcriptional regulator [Longimicrobiales bacterium]